MSIISQNNTKSELSNSISSFFSKYHIGNLLRKCNANKEKDVPVIRIFMYKLCNVFQEGKMLSLSRVEGIKAGNKLPHFGMLFGRIKIPAFRSAARRPFFASRSARYDSALKTAGCRRSGRNGRG